MNSTGDILSTLAWRNRVVRYTNQPVFDGRKVMVTNCVSMGYTVVNRKAGTLAYFWLSNGVKAERTCRSVGT
jgi:hypothetical protein